MTPKPENKKKNNLDQKIIFNDAESGTIKENIIFALNNSSSQEMPKIVAKTKALQTISDGGEDFSSNEIKVITESMIQTLRDGVTIQILKVIAPNDLK